VLFESVTLKNFLSYEDQKFEFKGQGLTLIEGSNKDEGGSNGSGKSAMWDGISWGLFGQTLRGLKADEVIRRKSKGGCRVIVTFSHSSSHYAVVRNRKDKEFQNRLIVHKDGKSIEKGTVALTQDWLLEELGIDFDLFKCTIMFAQGDTFNFVEATNKQQKEILSKIMRLNFNPLQARAKELIKDRAGKKEKLERQIEVLESHHTDDPESAFRKELDEWEAERRERFENLKEDLSSRHERMDVLKKGAVEPAKFRTLESKVAKRVDSLRAESLELQRKVSELKSLKMTEERALSQLSGLEGTCPTCRQSIDPGAIQEHKRAHEGRREKLTTLAQRTEAKQRAVEKDWISYQDKRQKLTEQRSDAERIQQVVVDNLEIIEGLGQQIKKVVAQVNPWIAKQQEAVERQSQIMVKLGEKKTELLEVRSHLPYYDFWVEAFGDAGIKSFLFDLVCATLTERANYYADILTNGQVVLNFDTQTKTKAGEFREKFECSVITDGEQVKYEAYSGGEKRRISLAVDMALSALMADYYESDFNIVVFDEQDTYLDREGRIAYMNLLKEKAKKKKVFVVAHDAEFKAMFDDVWICEKKDGVSCAR
jgi:DNA repair exonuclease SbcCD ATPase subunit